MEDSKDCQHIQLLEQSSPSTLQAIELKFSVPWGHIAGKRWGSPHGQRVLCVHGIQDNAGSFDHLIPLLPSAFCYVAIDLPGHGRSSHYPPGIPLNFMDYVLSLIRVLNDLKWESCYYLGHSLGGQLGMYLAAIWPERVKKIILLDAIAPMYTDADKYLSRNKTLLDRIFGAEERFPDQNGPRYSYEEAFHRMMNNRLSQLTEEAAKTLMKRSLIKANDEEFCFATDHRLKMALWPLVSIQQQLQILDQVKCPILAILTDLPKLSFYKELYRTLEYFRRKPNFQRIDVEGNHDVHLNHPERVAPHVVKFLTTQTSAL